MHSTLHEGDEPEETKALKSEAHLRSPRGGKGSGQGEWGIEKEDNVNGEGGESIGETGQRDGGESIGEEGQKHGGDKDARNKALNEIQSVISWLGNSNNKVPTNCDGSLHFFNDCHMKPIFWLIGSI
jgi:hypothetical protein